MKTIKFTMLSTKTLIPASGTRTIGIKGENKSTRLLFDINDCFESEYYYALFQTPDKSKTFSIKLEEKAFIVTNAITNIVGSWNMAIVCSNEEIGDDLDEFTDKIIAISSSLSVEIKDTFFDSDEIQVITSEDDLRNFYDEMVTLQNECIELKNYLQDYTYHPSEEEFQQICDYILENGEIQNGIDGKDGQDGVGIEKVELDEEYNLIITLSNGQVDNLGNVRGEQGVDGFTPTITSEKVEGKTTLTITNKDKQEIVEILDGQNGVNGESIAGQDGYSPLVSVEERESSNIVTITDINGEHTFEVFDGADGLDGEDGISPTIETQESNSGHILTINDINGEQTIEILNGKDGQDGNDGQDGFSPRIESRREENRTILTIKTENKVETIVIEDGIDGADGKDGIDGKDGEKGADGLSAYDSYLSASGNDLVDFWKEEKELNGDVLIDFNKTQEILKRIVDRFGGDYSCINIDFLDCPGVDIEYIEYYEEAPFKIRIEGEQYDMYDDYVIKNCQGIVMEITVKDANYDEYAIDDFYVDKAFVCATGTILTEKEWAKSLAGSSSITIYKGDSEDFPAEIDDGNDLRLDDYVSFICVNGNCIEFRIEMYVMSIDSSDIRPAIRFDISKLANYDYIINSNEVFVLGGICVKKNESSITSDCFSSLNYVSKDEYLLEICCADYINVSQAMGESTNLIMQGKILMQ